MKSWVLTAAFFLFVSTGVFAGLSQQEKMLLELDMIQGVFELKYAPLAWKKKYCDFDLVREIDRAKSAILQNPKITLKEYQTILRDFFNTPCDYHVGVYFYATELAALPFRIEGCQGRYFVRWIDSRASKILSDHMAVGDEVLSFGGEPIHTAVEALRINNFGERGMETDKGLAEQYLTFRIASLGHEVPRGPIDIALKRQETGEVVTLSLKWDYLAEKIIQTPAKTPLSRSLTRESSIGDHPLVNRNYASSLCEALHSGFLRWTLGEDINAELLGAKKSFVPTLGRVIWTSPSSYFHAYLYELPTKERVGYLRIPHYRGDTLKEMQDLQKIIAFFEMYGDAVVIDQVNNPGGFAFYMYAIASMLTEKPLKPPMEREAITHENVSFALNNINILAYVSNDEEARQVIGPLHGYPVTSEVAKSFYNHFAFLIEEWNAGKTITDPTFLLERITPHPKVRLSKPLMILVNHLDMSCGDYFPALMQDNGRAKIFGTKTAGAGGALLQVTYPNRFAVANFSLTASIAERANHDVIENLGVVPDVPYEVTLDDVMFGYQGYKDAVNEAVGLMISEEASKPLPPDSHPPQPYRERGGG
jgi:hypothetical protein